VHVSPRATACHLLAPPRELETRSHWATLAAKVLFGSTLWKVYPCLNRVPDKIGWASYIWVPEAGTRGENRYPFDADSRVGMIYFSSGWRRLGSSLPTTDR